MSLCRKGLFATALTLACASQAQAQDVQNFKPAVGTWNYLSVEGAQTATHLTFVPSVMADYANQPLVVRDENDKVINKLIEHLTTLDIMGSIGFFDRLELGVAVPVHFVYGEATDAKYQAGEGATLGDIRVIPKVRIAGLAPKDEGKGFGIAFSMPISIPTGDREKYVGADILTLNPKLILEGRFSAIQLSANAGFKFRPEKKVVEDLELGNEFTYGAGVGVELGHRDFVLMGEVFGAVPVSDVRSDSATKPLEADLGLRIFTNIGLVTTLGGGTGIIPDYGSPLYRVFLGLAYHKRLFDTDKDGIWDHEDACPLDPEDKDGFEDLDGCPDPDNDQDGILDINDKCPNDPEDKDGFEDADGCPDPDNDNDGICDPWVQQQGLSEKYASVCKAVDQCPDEAEDFDNFEDTDGCPDPDNDNDGICDPWVMEQGLENVYANICKGNDKCPDHPEDVDGFEDEDGCPDPDNDKDGILDINDKCPDEAEIFNGIDDEDGCPDGRVKVTAEKIEIMDKVYFETNKAVIRPVSFDILNQVAMVLRTAPHIKKVRVEGHTDSDGSDAKNLKLSDARAHSVMK